MSADEIVRLAACASKSSEDAKRAEAHARACKVYAKKVVKEANEINNVANDFIKLAQQALFDVIRQNNGNNDVTTDVLEALLQSSNGHSRFCDVAMLKTIWELDMHQKMNKELPNLILDTNHKQLIEQMISNPDQASSSHADEVGGSFITTSDRYSYGTEGQESKSSNILGAIPSALRNTQQGVFGVATKRKSRRGTKTRAMGVPSPLLSTEEVTIVRRATSPNPSQHSGMSPFVATQHKFSVRRKRSVTSQLTVTTDDEERPQSPLAMMTQRHVTSQMTTEGDKANRDA